MARKLKAVLAKLEDAAEKYRELYDEVDGQFVLSAEVEEHPDVANLRSALKRQKEGRGDLDAYKQLGTIAELREKLDRLEDEGEDGDGKKPKAAELERQVKSLTRKLTEATERTKKLEGGITSSKASKEVAEAIIAAGGNPRLLTDTLLKQVKVLEEDDDFVTVVVDHKGEPRLTGAGKRVALKDVVEGMKKDPDYADAFRGSGASGSGKDPLNTGRPAAEKTIAKGDEKAFLANLDGISKGTVAVQ